MLDIHASKETFEQSYSYPKDVTVVHVPYNGTPFSAHTILSKGDKTVKIQFGCGGHYPIDANHFIQNYFL